jgi:LPXTG-site transpeptidase (sortase) family protein
MKRFEGILPALTFAPLLAVIVALAALPLAGIAGPQLPALGGDPAAPLHPAWPDERIAGDGTSFRVIIPTIDVDVDIVPAPRVDYSWKTDHLIADAGHLEGTNLPGQHGNVVVVAHRYLGDEYEDASGPGPFADLDEVEKGDEVEIVDRGLEYTYEVTEQFPITREDVWVIRETPTETLTLMTCDSWNPETEQFEALLVVRAELVSAEPLATR